MNNIKNILIFGVTGQTGSWMTDYLLENTEHNIYGVVRRLSVKNHENIQHLEDNPRFHLLSGDLNDETSIKECFDTCKPDYCINFAAQSFVGESWNSPVNTWNTNSTALIKILEVIRKDYPNCRMGNAGSSEEWGNVVYSPQNEAHPPMPRSVYGASKCAARNIIKVYRESYNLYALQWWGTNHESERRGIEFVTRKITDGVAKIYHSIKNKDFKFEPILLGGYNQTRDWSHAYDFCDGIWKILNQENYRKDIDNHFSIAKNLGTFNYIEQKALVPQLKEYVLSSNESHSIREFLELAFYNADIKYVWHGENENEELLLSNDGKLATKSYIPLVKINSKFYRPADVVNLYGDSNLIRQELGWNPKISFKELVKIMVENDIKKYEKLNP
jgi:GDPmannose 4,6-dehydratase